MRNKRTIIIGVLMTIAVGLLLTTSQADIEGSQHDFSGLGWADGEICKPCHTPHHSNLDADGPLWNHELTTAEYELYSSPTLLEEIVQPGTKSVLCLSCHDGTVALDSFGGASGMIFITGDALVSTSLKDDHPVGVTWSHQYTGLNCANCHNPYDESAQRVLPFYEERVECLTCHEPHNQGAPDTEMLRITLAASELCQYCHAK